MSDDERRAHRRIQFILVGVMFGTALGAMDATMVAVALPSVAGEFQALSSISVVISAYLLALTAVTPICGKLSDIVGRRRLYSIAILLYVAGAAICAVSPNLGVLIAGRVVQGLGGGGLMPLAYAVMSDVIPPRTRGRYQGYLGSVYALSSLVGPLIGGLLVDGPGWRWIFLANIPLGVLCLLMVRHSLRDVAAVPSNGRLDVRGSLLLALGTVTLVGALTLVSLHAGRLPVFCLVALSGAAFVAYARAARTTPEAVIPLALLRDRTVATTSLTGLLAAAGTMGIVTLAPVFFQVSLGLSATASGLLLFPQMVGIVAGNIISGRRILRTGKYLWSPRLGLSQLTLSAAILLLGVLNQNVPVLAAGLLVLGLGTGFTMPVLIMAAQNSVEAGQAAVVSSVSVYTREVGNSLGTAAFGLVFQFFSLSYSRTSPALEPEYLNATPAEIAGGPQYLANAIGQAYESGMVALLMGALPVLALALVAGILVPYRPLRETT